MFSTVFSSFYTVCSVLISYLNYNKIKITKNEIIVLQIVLMQRQTNQGKGVEKYVDWGDQCMECGRVCGSLANYTLLEDVKLHVNTLESYLASFCTSDIHMYCTITSNSTAYISWELSCICASGNVY